MPSVCLLLCVRVCVAGLCVNSTLLGLFHFVSCVPCSASPLLAGCFYLFFLFLVIVLGSLRSCLTLRQQVWRVCLKTAARKAEMTTPCDGVLDRQPGASQPQPASATALLFTIISSSIKYVRAGLETCIHASSCFCVVLWYFYEDLM